MFTQQMMLDLLTTILCDMSEECGERCQREIASQFVNSFYVVLRTLGTGTGSDFNKISWIKHLRENITVPGVTVYLQYEPGGRFKDILTANRLHVQNNVSGKMYVTLGRKNLDLKMSKDFIDFMIDCVKQVHD